MKRLKGKAKPGIEQLLEVMARLRSPTGCPWDREQTHMTLRFHAVEEVYELMDAIEAGDEGEMAEELGDLLLQVVFHCQLAEERGAFDFGQVAGKITEKLIRRHPHVFGEGDAKTVDEVWTQWDKIKKAEKAGSKHERKSALDGIPRGLPALMYAEKLVKKARKANLLDGVSATTAKLKAKGPSTSKSSGKARLAEVLFDLAAAAQAQGWSAEEILRGELKKRERAMRRAEAKAAGANGSK
jgi:MazG family protein